MRPGRLRPGGAGLGGGPGQVTPEPPPGRWGGVAGPPPFRPSRLPREAVEVPLPGFLARVDPEEARRVQEKALAQHREHATFGPRTRRRLLRGALGGAAIAAVAGWLFLVSSTAGLLLFAALGALAGTAVAGLGLGATLAGLLFAAVAVGVLLAELGPTAFLRPPGVAKVVLFALLGAALAIGEAAQRSDGD